MPRPEKLNPPELELFLASHPAWKSEGSGISRLYAFPAYAQSVAFVVAVALEAERRDHHPDITLTWGKVTLRWSTHDAGGVTSLDVLLAETSDGLYHPSPVSSQTSP